jgi:hypothetical protein
VRFYFQYWNTLPFGVGITYFFFMLRFLYRGLWSARGWLLGVLLPPFLAFSVYWGFGSSGMLREGLHPWVLGALIASVVLWQRCAPAHTVLTTACSVALLLRGVETLLMLLLPSIATSHKLLSSQFLLGDCVALVTMLAAVSCLSIMTFRQALTASGLAAKKEKREIDSQSIAGAVVVH